MALQQDPYGGDLPLPGGMISGSDSHPDVALRAPAALNEVEVEPPPLVAIGPSLLPPPPTAWTDQMTGTDGPHYWDRLISAERARVRRYHRPVTVVFAEIAGLDRLSRQWGADVAERALVTGARRLAKEIRTSDAICRLETGRFGILLTETDEIAAINFVERARTSCEGVLRSASDVLRIGFGWASPPSNGDLGDAIDVALRRLVSDLAHGD
jgi:diguanylate cyclase (GGDEF)-like protein